MVSEYESEQKRLMLVVEEREKELAELQKKTVDLRMLLAGLREFKEIRELTPIIVNKLNKKGVTPFAEVTPHFQKYFLVSTRLKRSAF